MEPSINRWLARFGRSNGLLNNGIPLIDFQMMDAIFRAPLSILSVATSGSPNPIMAEPIMEAPDRCGSLSEPRQS